MAFARRVVSVIALASALSVCVGALAAQAESGEDEAVTTAMAGGEGHAASSEREQSEVPEIEVEVIGRKWGEQSVPSLSPTATDVISVIPEEEIEAVAEPTLADSLQFLPGLQVVRQGRKFERLVYVRGTWVPTVLLDGAQISAATTGFVSGFANRALYSIPSSAVERIEVIRSSSSLIYGPHALTGGVINIVTKTGEGPPRLEIGAEAGSYEHWRHTLSHFEGTEDRGVALVFEREIEDSNLVWGFRRMDHLFTKFNRTLDNGDTVKLLFLSNEGKRQVDMWSQEFQDAYGYPPVYWTFDPWRERFTSLAYAHELNAAGAGVDAIVWARNRFFRQAYFDGPIPPRPGPTVSQDAKDDSIGTSLFWRQPAGDDHFLRLGFQWFRINGYEQDFSLDPTTRLETPQPSVETDTKLTSYILQDEWTLAPGTRFFYGGRYEVPPDRDNAFTYSLGVERDLSEKTNAYARFGTGVQFPTETQLESDPTLEDQTSQNWDIGVNHYLSRNLVAHLGWFRSQVENEFIDYLRPGGDPTNRADYGTTQADETTSGVEVELQGGTPKLRWFANYTTQDRSVDRTPTIGDQPLQLAVPPDHMLNVGLRWSPDEGRTRGAVTFRYVSDYLASARYFAGAWPMDAYHVSNVSLSREFADGWRVHGAVNNLADEQYETQPGYPMPGRNWFLGVTRTVMTQCGT